MRFYTVLAIRPNYYDRNPLDISSAYSAASVAPHAITSRVTYTVPTSRKCFIEGLFLQEYRDAVAGAASFVLAAGFETPNGGAQARLVDVISGGNTQWVGAQAEYPSYGLLQAGDALSASTADGSTGGSNTYRILIKGTEFDV